MTLRKLKSAPCWPITVDEARRHLAVDASTRNEDALIDMLIQSASNDAEMKTRRILVESTWLWEPDEIAVGVKLEFPACPVTKVRIYDLDEELEEGQEPTDISADVCKIQYPSPEPQGTPMVGWLLPLVEFPARCHIELTVGYPYIETVTPIEQKDSPVLLPEQTSYTTDKLHLVFNRPVRGGATKENFTLVVNGESRDILAVEFEKGGVTLICAKPVSEPEPDYEGPVPPPETGTAPEEPTEPVKIGTEFVAGDTVVLTFKEGIIEDEFYNFVQPILEAALPQVVIATEDDFVEPEPVPADATYESLCPTPVKQWLLVRVGTLYSQRSEIALRAGKSNDALFPDGFINNLLAPYRVEFH